MSQIIVVGTKVARNDTVALYPEDIFPDTMDFDQTYTVLDIYTKTIPDMYNPIKFTVVKLSVGEINIDLLNKV